MRATEGPRTPILELGPSPKGFRRPRATKAEAEVLDKKVARVVSEIRSSWLLLGRLVERVRETRAFEALGFPGFHAWMTARLTPNKSRGRD
jgi:hypothetical protein